VKVVILGLSITSSWGNGHATNFRALAGALDRRGHELTFLERDVPWYASNRDLPNPPHGRTHLYGSVDELRERFAAEVAGADLVIVGSYVPDGVEVARWVQATAGHTTAFYDIDTPVTMAALAAGTCEYLEPDLIPGFDVYLSFTSGPTLRMIEERYRSPRAEAFHCLVDPEAYTPQVAETRWDLGYLGTYSDDRQPVLERLLLEPARRRPDLRFVVAGPQYPDAIEWPPNVERIEHLPPAEHAAFYAAQRLTLNVTRADMVAAGWSPSVRLFEAAACAVPVVSDRWDGLDSFFEPGSEIFLADGPDDVLAVLDGLDDERRRAVGSAARRRALAEHTAEHRVAQLEDLARHAGKVSTLQARSVGVSAEIAALGPWFHNLHLPDGQQTAADHRLGDFPRSKWLELASVLPEDLGGARALDIGCNAGFYSFELARRGADVVAIDHDEHYLRQARWAAGRFGLEDRVDLRLLGVYDLADLKETFDLVLFLGVLYHLRYPLLALDLVAEKVDAGGRLVLQTLTMPGAEPIETPRDVDIDDREQLRQPGWPTMAFVEHHLANDPTNWWVPDAAAVEAMVRTTGLRIVSRPGHEMWLCERERPSYHGPELDAAVGRRRRTD